MRYLKTCLVAVATATTLFYSSTSLSVDKYEIYGFFPTKWSSNTIAVCWENPSSANVEGRKWTREAIKETWERHSSLEFTGWSKCHNRSMGIRILIDDDGPHTKGLGSQLDGRRNGMVLNFTFNNWNRTCRRSLYFCVKVIAVHEFGHALGFAHEQNRPDAPSECQKERQGGDGDVYLSEYDPYSVMNYCNPRWSGGGTLSRKDIEGLQKWYGMPNGKPTKPTKPTIYGNTEGVYPQASTRPLTSDELGSMSEGQLKIMRNEIYARHGRIFKIAELKNYFNKQSWYQPKFKKVSHLLTETELKNLKLIQWHEKNHGNTEGVYPQASTRVLTHNNLVSMSKWQLKIMRNEIYARHGYIFKIAELKNYFNKQSWYQPKFNDVSHLLTPTELKNLKLIQQYEN
jgi:hypothetical protein